jgi:hypothetical protein
VTSSQSSSELSAFAAEMKRVKSFKREMKKLGATVEYDRRERAHVAKSESGRVIGRLPDGGGQS